MSDELFERIIRRLTFYFFSSLICRSYIHSFWVDWNCSLSFDTLEIYFFDLRVVPPVESTIYSVQSAEAHAGSEKTISSNQSNMFHYYYE